MSRLPIKLRSRGRTAVLPALAVLSAIALAGCNDDTPSAADEPAPTRSSAPAPSAPASTASTPADEPSSAAPSSTAPSSSAPPAPTPTGLAGRLPAADELPGFNAEWRWAASAPQDREGRKLFGTCQRFALTSIGATDVARRSYRSAAPDPTNPPDAGGALVAEFPDSTTARRAYAVLTAWRKQCADRLPAKGQVGELQDVQVPDGTGGWYLLTYPRTGGNPDEQFFDAQGMAVVGSRIALVSMRLLGQDYDYEPGQEPMVAAVALAGEKLG